MSDTTKTIYERLRDTQVELKAPKSEEGRFGKSRSAEKILEAAKPVAQRHGLTLLLSDDIVMVGDRHYVKATATVLDDTGGAITSVAHAQEGGVDRGLDAAQVTGKASSYARKYALGGLLAIDDTKDADTDHDVPSAPAKAPAKPKTTTPAKKAEPKDSDPVTDLEKRQLGNMMNALGMDKDAKSLMVASVLDKETVDTHGDFRKVVDAMEESPDEEVSGGPVS